MVRKTNPNQLYLDGYKTQFGGKLKKDNRWVIRSTMFPWDVIEDVYAENFSENQGVYAIDGRTAFGAIYIQMETGLTDREVVEFIAENPYAQYFLGKSEFKEEPLFDASMMVHFRKRFPDDFINRINEIMFEPAALEKMVRDIQKNNDKNDGNDDPPAPSPGGGPPAAGSPPPNKGKLKLDATIAPADIRYPNDLSLLNESRENLEMVVEELWPHSDRQGHKTTYNRKNARKEYLAIAKQRKPKYVKTRRAIGRQLQYIEKGIETIERLLLQTGTDVLPEKRHVRIETIRKVYRQQLYMYENKTHTCEDRIVSLRQPHIRPMVRGKAGKPYEFGQKISASVVEGYTFIERQSYDCFNEGIQLIESVERYRERFGCYPQVVQADQLYRNRQNLSYCRERGIRLSGPPLGRPKMNPTKEEKRQAAKDNSERNTIEGRFGIAKRRYGLDLVMSYLPETRLTEAAMKVFCMNVRMKMLYIFAFIFYWIFGIFSKKRAVSIV
jgi:hypothetical protein